MDIKMLTKRYSTPMYVKVIGTLLFPAVFIIMLVLPVFELIPYQQYANVFNAKGEATGSYEATTKSMFSMLPVDYHSNGTEVIFVIIAVLCVICGIAFLWMNRAKLAAIPASVMLAEIIFSFLRSPKPFYDINHIADFWEQANPATSTKDMAGCIMQYSVDGKDYIFRQLGQYWMLWVCGAVLLAFVIFAIAVTKTLIEKKK